MKDALSSRSPGLTMTVLRRGWLYGLACAAARLAESRISPRLVPSSANEFARLAHLLLLR